MGSCSVGVIVRARAAVGACVVVLAGLGACTQPTFPERPDARGAGEDARVPNVPEDAAAGPDAGVPSEASVLPAEDAGDAAQTEVVLPAGAERILGRYVRRSTSFNIDPNDFMARAVEHALLEFSRAPDGSITLHTQLCNLTVYNLTLSADLVIAKPEYLGAMDQPIEFNADGSFRADARSIIHGYDPGRATQAGCAGEGQREPRFTDQTWTVSSYFVEADSWNQANQCTCPGISAEPPITPADCRMVDGDNDGEPGITTVSSTLPLNWSFTLEVRIGYEDGQLGSQGPISAHEVRGLRVSCVDDDLGCGFGAGRPCVNGTSQVLFAPVDNAVDCAFVRENDTTLVAQPVPSFPTPGACRG